MDIQLEVGASGDGLLDKLKQVREQLQGVAKESAEFAKANQQAAQASIQAADQWIAKEKEMLASVRQQNERIREQSRLIQEMRAKYDELKAASAAGLDPKAAKAYTDQIKALKKEIDELKKSLQNTSKKDTQIIAPGSVLEARETVRRLREELANVDVQLFKTNKTAQQWRAELRLAERELKSLEKQAGLTAQSGNLLNKSWSFLRQAAYIIPGLGIAGIIGLITSSITDLISTLTKADDSWKIFRDISTESAKASEAETAKLRLLVLTARDENATKEAKASAIREINKMMPEYNNSINQENINTTEVNKKIDAYVEKIGRKARALAYMTQLHNLQNKLIEIENSKAEENLNIFDKWTAKLNDWTKKMTIGENLIGVLGATTPNAEEIGAKKREENADKVRAQLTDLQLKMLEDLRKGKIAFEDNQTKEEKEKRIKEFKDRSDQILALEKQLLDARINAMQDGRQKEIAIEDARYDDQVSKAVNAARKAQEEIEKVRSSNKSEADKKREIDELLRIIELENRLVEQEKTTYVARLLAIDLKYYEDAKKALEESQASISDVISKGEDKEIADLTKKYDKLYKAIEEARKKALQAVDTPVVQAAVNFEYDNQIIQLTEQQEKDRLNITKKYNLQRIAEDEKLAVAESGIIQKGGTNAIQLERIRQAAVLQVQIEAAEARIKLLESSNEKEDKIIVAQAKATIEKAKLELQKLAAKNQKDINIYSLLGFDISPQAQRDLEGAAHSITDSLLSVWRSYVDARVEEQERLMQRLQDDISKQESLVDKEKDLKEKGYANDYDLEQRKLDDMKRRSNEQNEILKKAQKEQQAYAKAQQIIGGTVSATKLTVAAAEYFAGGATYGPIVGAALSAAAIATMIATFASLKNQAKQLSNFQTYSGGGEFDATGNYPTHEKGGIDIVVGGKKKGEFEQGEYAYIFQDGHYAKQFKPFFEAINKRHMSDWRISPTGLELPADTVQNIIVKHETVNSPASGNADKHLASIDKNVKKMAAQKPTVEHRDGWRIERNGNHVRKIRIKKDAE